MRIALDISPISSTSQSMHKVRGVGYYIRHLQQALPVYAPEYEYVFLDDVKKMDEAVDILHVPYFDPFSTHLPLRKKIPTVITIHDLTPLVFPKYFPSGVKGGIRWRMQKFSAKQSDAIITDSNISKLDVIRLLGVSEKKVTTVYLAADAEYTKKEMLVKERLALLEKYSLPPKFVLYVGDVTWNKNVSNIIRAVKKTSLPLVLVGSAIKNKRYDHKNAWNKSMHEVHRLLEDTTRAFSLGFVQREDLVLLYNIATCLVMPSFYEGFGLPVLEAMQSGCPVITSRCGSLPEVAGDACLYVNPDDEEDIAHAIESIAHNSALEKELARKGIKHAAQFSWQKTAEETAAIYSRVAQRI